MKDLIFKNILIADVSSKNAKTVDLKPGLNIITSTENHVGKSSIVKSLYYSLGAEVDYDSKWEKNGKLYLVTFEINNSVLRVARLNHSYAVFEGDKLVLLTTHASSELSAFLSSYLGFKILMPNKTTSLQELAPPAFMFLPYYIDQDRGWGNIPYQSFLNLEQYSKKDREASLYYHLGIYNAKTIEQLTQIDANTIEINRLDTIIEKTKITISTLQNEAAHLLPASSYDELDSGLALSKERIASLVNLLSEYRSRLQKEESILYQYLHQLNVIQEYNKKKSNNDKELHATCPQCGYVFDEYIYNLVRLNYEVASEDFVVGQINSLIEAEKRLVNEFKEKYVLTFEELKQEENKVRQVESSFDSYVAYKGLESAFRNLQNELAKALFSKNDLTRKNELLRKQLRNLPKKELSENKYAAYLHDNLYALGAWDSKYEKQLKILKPLKGQGTLSNKIVLAQYISLFETKHYLQDDSIPRLPFVIDSPRGKEASKVSSKDILDLIISIDFLPQIVLVTVDIDDFIKETSDSVNVIRFEDQFRVLQPTDYMKNEELIVELTKLLDSRPTKSIKSSLHQQ